MAAATFEAIDYGEAPAVLVVADDMLAASAAEAAVVAAGGRIVATVSLAEAAARLGMQAALAAVVVEVGEDAGAPLDVLLDRIEQAARERRHAAVVIVPVDLIDAAMARITHPDVVLLADPDAAQRTAAIALACAARRLALRDVGSEGGAARLIELSEEVGRIARALTALSDRDSGRGGGSIAEGRLGYRSGDAQQADATTIRNIIRTRRLRDQYFAADLFADPAWDMLLDLMAARLERRGVAVSSLCIAAAVPPTTALRWIRTMTEHRILVRRADPIDGRRVFIELSEPTAKAMSAYLAAARQICEVQA